MVRNVIAEECLFNYIKHLGKTEPCTIGLILGQPSVSKDFVIHFTRTPQPSKRNISEENINSENNEKEEKEHVKMMSNFREIPDSWVGDHAKHATRMLPGGMYVLGIFVTTIEDIFDTQIAKIRNILSHVNKNLACNPYLHGNASSDLEKLVLVYNPRNEKYICKSIEYKTGAQKSVEFKFMAKPTKWQQLQCNYQFDHIIAITADKIDWNLKKHLQEILRTVEENLQKGVVMIDCEIKNEDESLESLGKKKQVKNKNSSHENSESRRMQVNIFVPCDTSPTNDEPVITACSGDMRFVGQLASRVFLNQKATIGEANKAVKEDIIRSLAARLEMHWDSLIEEEVMSPEEKCSVHEPPRRVFVALPSNKITLSDYLFPGEGPSEALISLEELLDLSVKEEDVIKDLELQAEPGDYYPIDEQVSSTKSDDAIALPPKNKIVYSLALMIALAILTISIIIPLLRQYL